LAVPILLRERWFDVNPRLSQPKYTTHLTGVRIKMRRIFGCFRPGHFHQAKLTPTPGRIGRSDA
jgi:hypothetical protein